MIIILKNYNLTTTKLPITKVPSLLPSTPLLARLGKGATSKIRIIKKGKTY